MQQYVIKKENNDFSEKNFFDILKATTPADFANRPDQITIPRLPLWVPLVGAMAGLILLVFIVIVCCLVCNHLCLSFF